MLYPVSSPCFYGDSLYEDERAVYMLHPKRLEGRSWRFAWGGKTFFRNTKTLVSREVHKTVLFDLILMHVVRWELRTLGWAQYLFSEEHGLWRTFVCSQTWAYRFKIREVAFRSSCNYVIASYMNAWKPSFSNNSFKPSLWKFSQS